MGQYLVNIGRVEEAISYFERIDSLLPESGAAANNLGSAFFLTGRFEDAAEAWEQAIARTPTVDIYANLGASYFFLQRFDEAAAMYRKGLNLAPKHFEMWGNYGDALMAAGAPDDERARVYLRAYELAEENLRINPSDAITLSLIGHYLARLGRDEEALKNVKLALELAQKDIYVYYFSAITLSTLNELDRAQQAADEALALGYPQFMLDADIGLQPLREQLRSKQNTVR
jgi:tetratricopeptide (TPR) repeat protein